jgi:hypothetical protein
LRQNTPPTSSSARFDRLRDVVAFSFQHAPAGECPIIGKTGTLTDNAAEILEYSGIAWPNQRMFMDSQRSATRSDPIETQTSRVSGYEAHSHSPQRLPPIASRGKDCVVDSADAKTQGPQSSAFGLLKNTPGSHKVISTALVQEDDPFVSSRQSPNDVQRWRAMLRSTSHDISMPDYVSKKSTAPTEMSGISFTRSGFERQVNEANPQEIVDALSPRRQEELLRALSASNSPVATMGTRPPANTPQMSADFADSSAAKRARILVENEPAEEVQGTTWMQAQQQPRAFPGTPSSRSTSEPAPDRNKDDSSPPLAQCSNSSAQEVRPLSIATACQDLNINRERSSSGVCKRKRMSDSMEDAETVDAVVSTTSSPMPALQSSKL